MNKQSKPTLTKDGARQSVVIRPHVITTMAERRSNASPKTTVSLDASSGKSPPPVIAPEVVPVEKHVLVRVSGAHASSQTRPAPSERTVTAHPTKKGRTRLDATLSECFELLYRELPVEKATLQQPR